MSESISAKRGWWVGLINLMIHNLISIKYDICKFRLSFVCGVVFGKHQTSNDHTILLLTVKFE